MNDKNGSQWQFAVRYPHSQLIKHVTFCLSFTMVTACSNVDVFKETSSKSDNSKQSSVQNDPAKDDENQHASQPVMVTGALLTCVELSSEAGSDIADAGCAIKANGVNVDLNKYRSTKWTLFGTGGKEVTATFRDGSASGGIYHALVSVAKSAMPLDSVQFAGTAADGKVETLSASITMLPRETPVIAQPKILTFGQGTDMQLGDNAITPAENTDCNARLDAVGLTGHGIRFPIIVTSPTASFKASITDLCGLRAVSTNRVRIKSGTQARFDQPIPPNSQKLDIPEASIAQGTSYIEIESQPAGGIFADRDDFIIGGITITIISGAASIGTPETFN